MNNGNGYKGNGMKSNTKNGNKSKSKYKRKISINKLRFILISALVFIVLVFGVSYLFSKAGNNNQSHDTLAGDTNKDGTPNQSDLTDNREETGGENTKTGDSGNTADNNGTTDKEEDKNKENEENEENKDGSKPSGTNENTPSNPQKPNVEKLDVEALEKLDNTKYSWWIKLNKEHKTPEITESIKNMIDKHDGIYVGDTSEKAIYLTFDEGYENGYTPQILDVLKDNDVKTIFFITGSYLDRNPELVKRMLDEGHQVGNHTVNHPSLPGLSYEKLEDEWLDVDKKFFDKFEKSFKYMRPPAGEYSERTLAAAKQLGYKTIFWSFAYDDWHTDQIRGAEYAYNKVMENLHNGAVYLLHAVSKDNADALDKIIKDIKAQGYEIKAFDL